MWLTGADNEQTVGLFYRVDHMRPKILYEIKDAEAKAQEMINDAEAEKRKLIEDAKRKASDVQEAAMREAAKNTEQMNHSADMEIDRLKQDILTDGRREVAAIQTKAEGKKAEAVAQIMADFKRTANV